MYMLIFSQFFFFFFFAQFFNEKILQRIKKSDGTKSGEYESMKH